MSSRPPQGREHRRDVGTKRLAEVCLFFHPWLILNPSLTPLPFFAIFPPVTLLDSSLLLFFLLSVDHDVDGQR